MLHAFQLNGAVKGARRRDTFAEHRKGWEAPIAKLLVKHKVSAVFHGHDHLYAKKILMELSTRKFRNLV